MRSLLCIAIVALGFNAPFVTAQSFSGGDNNLGVGVGVGGFYARGVSYSSVSPVFSFHYDRATSIPVGPGVLGIGGYFAYKRLRRYEEYIGYTEDYRYTYVMFGLRGTYHWNSWHGNDKLDTYAGVGIGYNVVGYRDRSTYSSSYYSGLYRRGSRTPGSARGSLFAGIRYYFIPSLGVFAEVGADVSFISGGLALHF